VQLPDASDLEPIGSSDAAQLASWPGLTTLVGNSGNSIEAIEVRQNYSRLIVENT
jgi:hypothetical protein